MSAAKEAADQRQYLTFFLAGEEYAISILRVKEIIAYGTLTKVPTMPPFIRGVINLRGSVVPVVDLAVRFGMPESPVTKWTCIVIAEIDLEGEQTVMGVMADAVNQVLDLSPDDIEAPPAFGTQVRIDYLLGMGKVGKKFALILDIDRVLSPEELLAVDSTRTAEQAGDPPDAAELFRLEDGPAPIEEVRAT
ncbi:MAG TPA: chemotaxis protein CheW [Blastocatellia bacterium]|nr:chemotaxis protein CheW [Blastocatellia bacterium]